MEPGGIHLKASLFPELFRKNTRMHEPHIYRYLIDRLLRLRAEVNGFDSPIEINASEVSSVIQDADKLEEMLKWFKKTKVPASGDGLQPVIGSYRRIGESRFKIYNSTTEKLNKFKSKIIEADPNARSVETILRAPVSLPPVPSGDWSKIKIIIRMRSNSTGMMRIFHETETGQYNKIATLPNDRLGLVGRGRANQTTGATWKMLELLAATNGHYDYSNPSGSADLETKRNLVRKHKSILAKQLQALFQLQENPFELEGAYKFGTKFKIELHQDAEERESWNSTEQAVDPLGIQQSLREHQNRSSDDGELSV